jgi:hypothetical protein
MKQGYYKAQNLLGCTAVFLIETSVDIQLRTRQYIPEDSELHTRRCENLKSHRTITVCFRLDMTVSLCGCMYGTKWSFSTSLSFYPLVSFLHSYACSLPRVMICTLRPQSMSSQLVYKYTNFKTVYSNVLLLFHCNLN